MNKRISNRSNANANKDSFASNQKLNVNNIADPLDNIIKAKIVRRSKSIAAKRHSGAAMIDATDYYKKYNDGNENNS